MLLCLLLFSIPALAIDLTFEWDKVAGEEWDSVSIYERTGTSLFVYQKVLTTDGTVPTAKLTGVTDKPHTYVARSKIGAKESTDSNTAVYTPEGAPVEKTPTPPGMFKVKKSP
jgi:hypothetical protein